MKNDNTEPLSKVIRIDESEIRGHLGKMVRSTVEETLNAMLDAEADEMCKAQRYEHSPDRVDTRAGNYKRKLWSSIPTAGTRLGARQGVSWCARHWPGPAIPFSSPLPSG